MAYLKIAAPLDGNLRHFLLLYLYEKGLHKSKDIINFIDSGKAVSGLRLPDGTFIRQSITIIEYFEDICDHPVEDWEKDLAKNASPSMRGRTSSERARTREILALAFKGYTLFGDEPLFELGPVDLSTLTTFPAWIGINLMRLEARYVDRFVGDSPNSAEVTVGDCAAFSLLELYSEYGLGLQKNGSELPNLKRFYEAFKNRDSAKVSEENYSSWA